MLKATQGKQRAKKPLLFFILPIVLGAGMAVQRSSANAVDNGYCSASEAYLAEIKKNQDAGVPVRDFSCLTDLPSLSDSLHSYQLIDTRVSDHIEASVAGAWRMSVEELRNIAPLKAKRLLLVGQGFSRARAAGDCATLKSAGFEQVKILVGGADTWNAVALENNPGGKAKVITAKELVFEYFNSQVELVTLSESLSTEIKELGLSNYYFSPQTAVNGIRQIAINNSGNGFFPIVIITDSNTEIDNQLLALPNVYQLENGTAAISDYFEKSLWTNLNRTGVPRRYLCGSA